MSGIFLVEDDDRLSELMRDYLTGHGYPVTVQRDGARAVETLQHIDPAVVLLDLQLPGRDGFEVCKEIRAHYRGVIMMLTARTDDIDQVLGLELGADDYIAKPVQPRVLLARIRAHLRRKTVEPCAGALCFGEFRIERAAREVVCQGRTIEMTTAEFDLLWCLAKKGGEVLSRDAPSTSAAQSRRSRRGTGRPPRAHGGR